MSITDDLLILASQKFEEDARRVVPSLGNEDKSDKTDENLYKKQNQMMTGQLMSVAAIVMLVDEGNDKTNEILHKKQN